MFKKKKRKNPIVVQVWRVVDFCCQYLEKEVSEDNYLYLQELALLYSLERLDTFIDFFVLSHFATLSFTPDFLQNIPLHKLTSYLSSSQVCSYQCLHILRIKVHFWQNNISSRCDPGIHIHVWRETLGCEGDHKKPP